MAKVLRDGIHDYITFEDDEEPLLDVVDTFAFQRLRRIRQNGAGYLVYHGLEASRFGHAVGTYEVSKRVLEAVERACKRADLGPFAPKPHTQTAFKAACLMHDLGHPCFSHLGERFFKTTAVPREDDDQEASHEMWTRKIVEEDEAIQELIADQDWYEEMLSFLRRRHPLVYLRKMFSGNLDVDRFDYLNRDTRMAGTGYGLIDIHWLLRCMDVTVFDSGWDEPRVHIIFDAAKGTFAVEHFLLARRAMYAQIYFHKAVRAAEAVVVAILLRAHDLGLYGDAQAGCTLPDVLRRLAAGEEDISVADYLSIDDSHVLACIVGWARGGTTDEILADLSQRYVERSPFKSIPIADDVYETYLKGDDAEANETKIKDRIRANLVIRAPATGSIQRDVADYYFAKDDCTKAIYETGEAVYLGAKLPDGRRRFFPLEEDTRIGQKFAEGNASENVFRQVFLIVPEEAYEDVGAIVQRWSDEL